MEDTVEQPRFLDPNPSFLTAEVSSSHIDEAFEWLSTHSIDSLTIDGNKLVHVDAVQRQEGGTYHVICSTEEGASHLFSFNPFEDGPIDHLMISND